jgi:hypothetical protein
VTGPQEDQVARIAAALHVAGMGCEDFTNVEQEPGWPGGHPFTMHNSQAAALVALGLRLPDSRVDIAEPGLDAAWAEAEAALPEGYWIDSLHRSEDGPGWTVDALGPEDGWFRRDGPTPIAAVNALRDRPYYLARLRENQP